MKIYLIRSVCLLLLGLALPSRGIEYVIPAEPETGQQLAERVCSLPPAENSEIRGKLETKVKKTKREIPVTCSVILHDGTWETIYNAAATSDRGAERLIITHKTNGPNQYLYARAMPPSATLPAPAPVTLDKVSSIPFAGSDFSIGDLGLEFLHWPQQTRQKGQMRLGQSCYVLESRNDNEPEIVRVRSFIDQETGGVLVAEGYNRQDKGPVKEFSLHGSSFKKVNGHWRLENMEISNDETGSVTTMRFDVNGSQKP